MERAGLAGELSGKTLLELGPGDSIASAIMAAAEGARAILVDSGAYVRADIGSYLEFERSLAAHGGKPLGLGACPDVDSILSRCGARYLTHGLESLKTIESGTVDCMFSQAVLEHVRRHEFLATLRECRRILRPGGICSHRVDLRDHLGGSLNNLRFSQRLWESKLFTSSGFYTNRISFSRMLELFVQAGFDVQVGEVRRWKELPLPKNKLAPEFAGVPVEDLCVQGFDVLLR